MVGSRGVVAHRRRRPRPAEHRAGVAHPRHQRLGVGHDQLEVLGGDLVDHLEGLLDARAQHAVAGVAQGRLYLVAAVGPGCEPGDLGLHRRGGGLVPGDQPGQPVGAVLGLQDHVGRRERGVRAGVGHHHDLRGARERGGDAHHAGHLPLGQRHVDVARSHDHVHGTDRLGAVGQGGDSLGPAHRMDLVHTHRSRRGQRHVGDAAVGSGWHAHSDLVHAGDFGRNRGHDQRRRVGGPSSGHVAAGPAHRPVNLPDPDTALLVEHVVEQLVLVVGLDVGRRGRQGVAHFHRCAGRGLGDLVGRHREAGRLRAVEALG